MNHSISDADKALCALFAEFGWATGHGDTLVDLISELASNMRKDKAAAEMTKRCYGGCLKDVEQLYAEGKRLFVALREIEEIADDNADVDDGEPNHSMRILVVSRAALNIQERTDG